MKRHPSSIEAKDLAELVAQVSRQRPDLLSTCLWLIFANPASRRVLVEWEPSAGRLIELRRLPGEIVGWLIDSDHIPEMKIRRHCGAGAGLFPRGD